MMAEFARSIGGMPDNVCAMTTVTSGDKLGRVDELREVKAHVRGLSIEPLWSRIPAKRLNLKGIDWGIVGGESGKREIVRPFHVEWAVELMEHCHHQGVAFFLKQLGKKPTRGGEETKLNDSHGGDWDEWDRNLRVREMPEYFRTYRESDLGPAQPRRGTRSS